MRFGAVVEESRIRFGKVPTSSWHSSAGQLFATRLDSEVARLQKLEVELKELITGIDKLLELGDAHYSPIFNGLTG